MGDVIRGSLESKDERFAAFHLARGGDYFVAAMAAPGDLDAKRFEEIRRVVEKAVQAFAAK